MTKRLILVGNGMSGIRFLEKLTEADPTWSITVFGDEPHSAYDRIALSKVLAGSLDPKDIVIRDRDWYERTGIRLEAGCPVVRFDSEERWVEDVLGRRHEYEALVLATGSLPFIPPIEGSNLDGVMAFRTLDEVQEMIRRARPGAQAVVVGGGLLGLECARGLQQRDMQVTVVHLMDRLMERQLDLAAGSLLRDELQRMGMRVMLPVSAKAIQGDGRVESVLLTSGDVIPADLVVICSGIKPNTALAAAAGLEGGRGVKVNDRMHTSAAHVYAGGEGIEHRGVTYGLVEPL